MKSVNFKLQPDGTLSWKNSWKPLGYSNPNTIMTSVQAQVEDCGQVSQQNDWLACNLASERKRVDPFHTSVRTSIESSHSHAMHSHLTKPLFLTDIQIVLECSNTYNPLQLVWSAPLNRSNTSCDGSMIDVHVCVHCTSCTLLLLTKVIKPIAVVPRIGDQMLELIS